MGKRDIPTVVYFQDDARYADLINGFIFDGEQVISETDIQEIDSRVNGIIKKVRGWRGKFQFEKYRDIVRRVACGMDVMIIGLEHQDKIHYAMPIRVMLMDAVGYYEQLLKIQKLHKKKRDIKGAEFVSGFAKSDKVMPMITIVVYYGEDPWDGPRNLSDLIACERFPEKIKEVINSYPIHILEVRTYPDVDKFRTDLREVFEFIQKSTDETSMRQYFSEREDQIVNLDDDACEMMIAVTGSEELEEIRERCGKKEGRVNMCKGLKEWKQTLLGEGRAGGRTEATYNHAHNMFRRNMPPETIASICEINLEQVNEWIAEWR